MLRKILLLICIAFVVVCYGYPCLILPMGSYTHTYTVGEIETTAKMQFGFNGKVKIKVEDEESEFFYKLKGNTVLISDDETFDEHDGELQIVSMYKVENYTNAIGMYATIGIGILAVVLVLTAPSRR